MVINATIMSWALVIHVGSKVVEQFILINNMADIPSLSRFMLGSGQLVWLIALPFVVTSGFLVRKFDANRSIVCVLGLAFAFLALLGLLIVALLLPFTRLVAG